jgi:23S rRNA G2445 N2-methylase RlmL
MRETLAAGVLALAGHVPTLPLWDPMCGSGTLIIEGALAARGMAPGLGRRFAAEDWPLAQSVDWATRRRRLEEATLPRAPAPVVGSDVNAGSLGTARRNARRAGVLEDRRLERLEVGAATPGALAAGLWVSNLPYGIRVGERRSLAALDASLARVLAGPFRTWRGASSTMRIASSAWVGSARCAASPEQRWHSSGARTVGIARWVRVMSRRRSRVASPPAAAVSRAGPPRWHGGNRTSG